MLLVTQKFSEDTRKLSLKKKLPNIFYREKTFAMETIVIIKSS